MTVNIILKIEKKNLKRNQIYRENNKEEISKRNQEYYQENKDKIREYHTKYRKFKRSNNPLFKLKDNIRTLISNSVTKKGYSKSSKTFDILGCSFDEFKQHIESQFEDWMTWDNHGKYNGEECYGWDIYHIIPTYSHYVAR